MIELATTQTNVSIISGKADELVAPSIERTYRTAPELGTFPLPTYRCCFEAGKSCICHATEPQDLCALLSKWQLLVSDRLKVSIKTQQFSKVIADADPVQAPLTHRNDSQQSQRQQRSEELHGWWLSATLVLSTSRDAVQ